MTLISENAKSTLETAENAKSSEEEKANIKRELYASAVKRADIVLSCKVLSFPHYRNPRFCVTKCGAYLIGYYPQASEALYDSHWAWFTRIADQGEYRESQESE